MDTPSNDMSEILMDQDRVLVAAWMLPSEGSLTEAQRSDALSNFHRYIRRNDLTPAHVAHQLGLPTEHGIIGLIKGRRVGDVDKRVRRLNLWVEQHARQRTSALPEKFVETKVAKDVYAIARVVRENRTMGLLVGPAGIGKTRCVEALHDKYVGSIVIRVIIGYHHPKGLTHALAVRLGVRNAARPSGGTYNQIQLERVIDRLKDTGTLIIVDEAHRLEDKALEVLRDVHDCCGVPILCFSTKDLHDRLLRNASPDHGQTYSRFDVIHHLTQGCDVYSGGRALFTTKDIRALYDEVPIRLSPDAVEYLQGVANRLGRGSLRRCRMLLQNAARRARKRGGLTDGESVTVVSDDLDVVENLLRRELGEHAALSDRRRRSSAVGG